MTPAVLRGQHLGLPVLLVLLVTVLALRIDPGIEDEPIPLHQLANRLLEARNVCVTSLLPNVAKPNQEEWISRSLNLIVLTGPYEGRDACALWNLSDRTIHIKFLEGGEIKALPMSDKAFARAQQRMTRATGLVPFDEIANLPEGAVWEKVADPNAAALVPGTQVYDLVWTKPIPTIPPTRRTERGRFFVDPRTHLPSRVEMYSQEPTEPQPRLFKTLVVTFPTDQEILTLVQTLFPDLR
jgi:hypothetical protein